MYYKQVPEGATATNENQKHHILELPYPIFLGFFHRIQFLGSKQRSEILSISERCRNFVNYTTFPVWSGLLHCLLFVQKEPLGA